MINVPRNNVPANIIPKILETNTSLENYTQNIIL